MTFPRICFCFCFLSSQKQRLNSGIYFHEVNICFNKEMKAASNKYNMVVNSTKSNLQIFKRQWPLYVTYWVQSDLLLLIDPVLNFVLCCEGIMEVLLPQKVLKVYFAVHTSVANIQQTHTHVYLARKKWGQIPEII